MKYKHFKQALLFKVGSAIQSITSMKISKKVTISPKYSGNDSLRKLVGNLPDAIASGKGDLIYDKRNKIHRFRLNDGFNVIVKQFKKPNLFQRICYSTFWNNKAKKSYDFGNRLLSLGIDTPEPIASVTYYNQFGIVDSYYFVSTEDTRADCTFLNKTDISQNQPFIDALSAYLISIHEKGFLHGDTNLSNFLYEKLNDGTFQFAVIDTNRSRLLSRHASMKDSLKNLVRITHNRSLLLAIIHSYTIQRHWNANNAEMFILFHLRRMERREKQRGVFKKIFELIT